MKLVDNYSFSQPKPFQSIIIYVISIILKTQPAVKELYSYRFPFYNIGKNYGLY